LSNQASHLHTLIALS